jgi:hypothetical protein
MWQCPFDPERWSTRTNSAGRRSAKADELVVTSSSSANQEGIHMNSSHSKTHSSEAQHTTNHDVIRKWAEERGGKPATVKATEEKGHAGILRIDFDPPDEGLDRIGWDEFFEKFDDAGIAFLHQDRTKDGKLSRFHKFVRA